VHVCRCICKNECVDGVLQDLETPLHLSAVGGHLECVKYLVEKAKVNMECRNIVRAVPCEFASDTALLNEMHVGRRDTSVVRLRGRAA
jgi:ankyrin repeat protein